IYIGVGLLLTVGGIALLIQAAVTLVTSMDAGVEEAVKATLDLLLLVFIFVELLGAVRSTVRERKLVAEPFLIIGIIASIKEIVVISISAKDDFGSADGSFEDAMLEVGILAGLVVALALAMFLSRLKEREPEE
ncbi:MAG: phosphate-starvation-inducible PsiE family protein, partial [Actinomycetota bacterium]|nr:phosphate-starvation-inducible PsiE family protein [Actinomycetota bacterium]